MCGLSFHAAIFTTGYFADGLLGNRKNWPWSNVTLYQEEAMRRLYKKHNEEVVRVSEMRFAFKLSGMPSTIRMPLHKNGVDVLLDEIAY